MAMCRPWRCLQTLHWQRDCINLQRSLFCLEEVSTLHDDILVSLYITALRLGRDYVPWRVLTSTYYHSIKDGWMASTSLNFSPPEGFRFPFTKGIPTPKPASPIIYCTYEERGRGRGKSTVGTYLRTKREEVRKLVYKGKVRVSHTARWL